MAAVIFVGRVLDPRPGCESYLYAAGRDRSSKR